MPEPTIAHLARKTADYRRALVGMFKTEMGYRSALDLMGLQHPTPEQAGFARVAANTHSATLAQSELFLADHDMVDLLDTAAPTMPDQDLQLTDIITPHGFVYFATPLPDRSGQPPVLPLHAMSWAFVNQDHPVLGGRAEGDSVLITSYVLAADVAALQGFTGPLPENTPRHIPSATVVWTVGTLIGEVFGEVPSHERFTPGFFQRVLAAFWTLVQQPRMTTTDKAAPGRPTDIRKARRTGIENAGEPVRVIRLHTTPATPQKTGTADGSADDHGKMRVRALTRGHWRRQWYATVKSHRHIFIEAHWRGPADGPVVGGERVFLAHGTKVEQPE